jgi:hypothetical protein
VTDQGYGNKTQQQKNCRQNACGFHTLILFPKNRPDKTGTFLCREYSFIEDIPKYEDFIRKNVASLAPASCLTPFSPPA